MRVDGQDTLHPGQRRFVSLLVEVFLAGASHVAGILHADSDAVDALQMHLSPKEDRKLAERRIDNGQFSSLPLSHKYGNMVT
jgi:hypothetical protein